MAKHASLACSRTHGKLIAGRFAQGQLGGWQLDISTSPSLHPLRRILSGEPVGIKLPDVGPTRSATPGPITRPISGTRIFIRDHGVPVRWARPGKSRVPRCSSPAPPRAVNDGETPSASPGVSPG